MEKCNKIVIFDWGGVIENNNQSYYNISKAIIDIMRKYKCKLTDQEILEVCTNGKKLFNTFIDDDEQTTIDWFNEIKDKLNILLNDFVLNSFILHFYFQLIWYLTLISLKNQ